MLFHQTTLIRAHGFLCYFVAVKLYYNCSGSGWDLSYSTTANCDRCCVVHSPNHQGPRRDHQACYTYSCFKIKLWFWNKSLVPNLLSPDLFGFFSFEHSLSHLNCSAVHVPGKLGYLLPYMCRFFSKTAFHRSFQRSLVCCCYNDLTVCTSFVFWSWFCEILHSIDNIP